MKARPGELKFGWNARERDHGWAWGGAGAIKADGNMVYGFFGELRGYDGTTLLQELEARGYDMTTLRFSIQRRRERPANID